MKRGFTLIELMVVVAIATILTTVVISSTSGSRARSRDLRRQSDVREIQLALELFKDVDASRNYPPTGDGVTGGTTWQDPLKAGGFLADTVVPPVPPEGQKYLYEHSAMGKHYCLGVVVEGDPVSFEGHETTKCTTGAFAAANVFKVYK